MKGLVRTTFICFLLYTLGSLHAVDSIRFNNNQLQTAYGIRQTCAYAGTMGQSYVQMDNLNPDEINAINIKSDSD